MAMDLPIPAVRQQIASAIDLFVHLGRLRDRKRRVLEIAEVVGMENGEVKLHSLYEYEGGEKGWRQVGRLERLQKMGIAGNEWGFQVGTLPKGARDKISDVPGVTVGHCTLADGAVQTGVTALLPHQGDVFHEKVLAASYVINGFGKTTGLVQIDELGTLETPILFTNTLSVGTVETALVKYMLDKNPDICETTGSVNPVVCECNDSGHSEFLPGHAGETEVKRVTSPGGIPGSVFIFALHPYLPLSFSSGGFPK